MKRTSRRLPICQIEYFIDIARLNFREELRLAFSEESGRDRICGRRSVAEVALCRFFIDFMKDDRADVHFSSVKAKQTANRTWSPDLQSALTSSIFFTESFTHAIYSGDREYSLPLTGLLFHSLPRRRQHELDPVQLIDFRCARVVVDRCNIGLRISGPELLDDAFPDDVVGQAGEGLDADDVGDTALDEFQHLAGQEPSLAGLISGRGDRRSPLCKLPDIRGRIEVNAPLEFP